MACNKYIIKDGKPGKDGLSAYEIAVKNGFIGTEQEWLDSLKGSMGPQGIQGFRGFDGIDGTNGSDGRSVLVSYVFTRQQDGQVIQPPTGGSFQNPLPDQSEWTDGVPLGQGSIYMSYRIFTSDGLPPQQPIWSNPILAADSALIDFEWSSADENPGNPTDNPSNWTNQASVESKWLAIRTLSNGEWSDWNVIRIKGEKGDTGQSGLFTSTIYAINGSWIDPPSLDRSERFPAGWVTQIDTPVTTGQYVWWSQALIDPLTNQLVDQWTIPVRMSGEKGEQGQAGASITYRGDYNNETQYKGSPVVIDFVIYDNGTSKDGYLARTDAGDIPVGTLPTDTDYWNGPIENVDALFTDFLIAYSAYIQDLIVGALKTTDSGSRVEVSAAPDGSQTLRVYNGDNIVPEVILGMLNSSRSGLKIENMDTVNPFRFLVDRDGILFTGQGIQNFMTFNSGMLSSTIDAALSVKNTLEDDAYGIATNSLYIQDNITVFERLATSGDAIPSGFPIVRDGWTGVHNGMQYIKGVAVGPV